jgi:MHS family citrate/tricarballylate:H+ symporter-like MFS transporter
VESGAPPRLTSRPVLMLALMGIAMIAGNTIATYTMNYMGTYAVHTLGLPPRLAFAATVTTGFCCAVSCVASGWLSDRVGRKPVMIGGSLALLAAGVPCFVLLTHTPSLVMLVAMSAVMATLLGFNGPPIIAGLTESVPPRLRAGSLGITYAVGVASFGGTAQFMVAWLTKVTGSSLAPAWYMSGALVIGLFGMLAMKETAPVRIGVK